MVLPETIQETGSFYSRVAPRYAEEGPPYFAHAGRRLVEVAQVRPDDVVLDLGTGRGAVLLPAARRVGPGGRAIGVDIATEMLAYTRRTLESEQLTHASVQLMDVSALDFERAQFTHVLSSFSVFFFPDLFVRPSQHSRGAPIRGCGWLRILSICRSALAMVRGAST